MSVLNEVKGIFEQLVAWRRDLHQHPELGLQEHRTAKLVATTLRDLGYAVQEGIGQTGVVGLLENGDGPVIMARVDMDALPIQENNTFPYTSQTDGRMHACGHDAHVAMGLGIATLMAGSRDTWRGTLKLIFQPGEEGMDGAMHMINDGVLENPRPEKALAIHVWNALPVGTCAAVVGPIMAAAESWKVKITGKGGHAAHPETTIDPVVVAAMMVNNIQTVVSRNVAAQETAVVTVGRLHSGDTFNVIPDTAELQGTVRTYTPEVRATVLERLEKIIRGTATMMDAQAELIMNPLTPAVVNDQEITHLVQGAIRDLFGEEALNTEERTMGSEDAALFLQEIPGCYIFIGSGFAGQEPIPHHNPRFDIDENSMLNGCAVLLKSLRRLMPVEN